MRFTHILRCLRQSPLFTVVAVLTLAIGIGANTAIFSVIDGILLKPLPYAQPDGLILLDHSALGLGIKNGAGIAPFLYFTYREQNRTLGDVGMWQADAVTVTGLAEPEQVPAVDVTEGCLPLLGVQPVLGRWFSENDESPGGPDTVMLTYPYWQARFGGDRSVVGRRVVIEGKAREVIGVMPEGFRFLDSNYSLLLPLPMDRNKVTVGNFSFGGFARLKRGMTLTEANSDLTRMIPIALNSFPVVPGFSRESFEKAGLSAIVLPLKQSIVGDIGSVLWILMGTIGMVLLIACANVANLLLVRAEARQQELAIRAALGAGWSQIARELLLESVTLGILGGMAGLAIAYGATQFLLSHAPAHLPRLDQISIDPVVLLFTLGISLFAGAVFGLIPVIKYAGPRVAGALRAGGRTLSQSKERHRARSVLVVAQVALALVLLISAGLMIRSFEALRHVEPGFAHPEEIQTLMLSIPQMPDKVQIVRTEQAILDKIAAIPGVASVGLSSTIPMDGMGWHDPILTEDYPEVSTRIPPLRNFKFVSPGLLQTMGNRLVGGRDFTWTDIYEKRPVAMVSENVARELWHTPGGALGRRIRDNPKGIWREIIGVVGDERDAGVDKPASSIVYWPILMDNFSGNPIMIRSTLAYMIRSTRTGSSGFLNEVRQAVWQVNPNLPLAKVRTLEDIYNKSMARTSFTLVMLAIAGAMALLLGLVGIYGVISYSLSQRTREIGIRMALGAQRGEMARMFVVHGLRLAAIGIVCGIAGAFLLTRLMSSLLFGVAATDPATYAMVAVTLALAAAVASYLPALRATNVDPADALRAE